LFTKCDAIYEYQAFIAYFPNSEFVPKANIKITEIKEAEELRRRLKEDKKIIELLSKIAPSKV
jgi:hypothetical protein